MTEEEVQGQLDFLTTKVERALRSISSMNSSLSTGATWQRIHGAILVPDSVGNGVITDGAITETKIDSLAVSTPKIQANAITAAKLEANLVLASNIIGGTFSDPNIYGVVLGTAGLKLFDGGGTQRGWLKTDGSGWFGASNKFYWDTAGNIVAAGITVASSASGARTQLDTGGLRIFNSSEQVILELNSTNGFRGYNSTGSTNYNRIAMDGSGWLGSSDGTSANSALSWTGAGVATLNASKIITGTLNCSLLTVSNLSATSITTGAITFASGGTMNGATISGTFGNTGGTMNLGKLTVADSVTLGTGGKIIDADGSYWDQNGIVLRATGTLGDSILFNRDTYAPYGNLQSAFATDLGQMRLSTVATTSRSAALALTSTAVDSTTLAEILTTKSGGTVGSSYTLTADGAHGWYVNASTVGMTLERTNRALSLYGRLYPGSGSGTQTARYFSDNGSRIVLTGGDLDINNMTTSNPGNTAWASRGFSADGGGYVVLYVNGTGYKIPTYA